ncbi:MAG: hypothetical protein NZM09_01685 [Ignavibacterium sp.]|nr:hypothetical protein [Ignavibacterium sp.]MCX7611792.1 hypothetical protein [Ignavibacterium sp.]MDW8374385.1 hypothetical protein [Ignavibacteriales bacterium]
MLNKNFNIASAFVVFFISSILFYCSFSEKKFPVEPTFNPDSLTLSFPTGIGFEWTYRDSLSNNFYGIVTTKIVSNQIDSLGRLIWNVENNSYATKLFLSNQFFIKNDSLFAIDRAPFWQGRIPYLRLIPPKKEEFIFSLQIDDTRRNYRVNWNRNKTIKTEAGQFNYWISLIHSTQLMYDSVIVVPRIGIVYRYYESRSISGQINYVNKSELIRYKLN